MKNDKMKSQYRINEQIRVREVTTVRPSFLLVTHLIWHESKGLTS